MNTKKGMLIALVLLLGVISFTKAASVAADPANHRHAISQTEDRIASVMKLSGGAAAASAALSLLPGDMCTPLAQQLADLAKYFLLVLSALYLEKFLISLSGYLTFMVLIPIACLILCAYIVCGKKVLLRTAGKIALTGAVIFLIVPASVWLSDVVYRTQASTVEAAIEEYDALDIEGEDGSGGGLLDEAAAVTTGTVDRITSYIENLLESLAVMIVTSCVIPILVFVFLVWIVKTIFAPNILVMDASFLNALAKK